MSLGFPGRGADETRPAAPGRTGRGGADRRRHPSNHHVAGLAVTNGLRPPEARGHGTALDWVDGLVGQHASHG
jgi:hypothetical protein